MNKDDIQDLEELTEQDYSDEEILRESNEHTKDKKTNSKKKLNEDLNNYVKDEISRIEKFLKLNNKKEFEEVKEEIQKAEPKRKGRPKNPPKEKKEKKPYVMTEKRKEALDKGRQKLIQRQKEFKMNNIKSKAEILLEEFLKTKEGKRELDKKIKIAKLKSGYVSSDDEEHEKPRRRNKKKDDSDIETEVPNKQQSKPKITIQQSQKLPKYTF